MRKLTKQQQRLVQRDAEQQWARSRNGQLYVPLEIGDDTYDALVALNDYETLWQDAARLFDDLIVQRRFKH